jgi:hypothetical protein
MTDHQPNITIIKNQPTNKISREMDLSAHRWADASSRIAIDMLTSPKADTNIKRCWPWPNKKPPECSNGSPKGYTTGGGDITEAREHLYDAIVGVR